MVHGAQTSWADIRTGNREISLDYQSGLKVFLTGIFPFSSLLDLCSDCRCEAKLGLHDVIELHAQLRKTNLSHPIGAPDGKNSDQNDYM